MANTLKDEIEKFLTFPSIEEQIGAKPKFGRLILQDERSKDHPLRAIASKDVKPTVKPRKERKWRARWQGNQGSSSMCTAFSFLHCFEHEPINHPRSYGKYKGCPIPCVDPRILYCEAQQIDPWPGGCRGFKIEDPKTISPFSDYDGTSVLAMMKVAQTRGYISEYNWEFSNVDTVVETVMNKGPVIVGTNWYRQMELKPNDPNTNEALLLAQGSLVGGHAYLIDEVNLTRKGKGREIGIFNSWGPEWGWSGRAYMSLDTLEKLIREDGEVVFATEIP